MYLLEQHQWFSADGGGWASLSPGALYAFYTLNLTWSLFLTSTALHAIFLITSPLQAVYKWYRRQNSDSDTAIPYVCACVGSALWLRYSVFIEDLKLILLQSYAVLMQSFYLLAMLYYRSKKRRLLRLVVAICIVMTLLFVGIAHMSAAFGLEFTGTLASGAQIAGSLVCPYLIYKAISTRLIDFVPFAPVAFTWVMELHAIIYSVAIRDRYLLTANIIFFCMDGCLLAMFFIFPTESSQQKQQKQQPSRQQRAAVALPHQRERQLRGGGGVMIV